jgi:hypothetical protein
LQTISVLYANRKYHLSDVDKTKFQEYDWLLKICFAFYHDKKNNVDVVAKALN